MPDLADIWKTIDHSRHAGLDPASRELQATTLDSCLRRNDGLARVGNDESDMRACRKRDSQSVMPDPIRHPGFFSVEAVVILHSHI